MPHWKSSHYMSCASCTWDYARSQRELDHNLAQRAPGYSLICSKSRQTLGFGTGTRKVLCFCRILNKPIAPLAEKEPADETPYRMLSVLAVLQEERIPHQQTATGAKGTGHLSSQCRQNHKIEQPMLQFRGCGGNVCIATSGCSRGYSSLTCQD